MYCPKCSNTFAKNFSKCPDCQCWLKPNGPKSNKVATAKPKVTAGANSGSESSQWGWDAPSEGWLQGDRSQSGWGETADSTNTSWSAPPPPEPQAEPQSGWLAGAPESQPQAQSGWLGGGQPEPQAESQSGWLGGGQPEPQAESQSGWLGGGQPEPEPQSQSDWMGDDPQESRGWLGDPQPQQDGPSSRSDEAVDEQWLEEENWDHRELDEYSPPPAEPPSEGHGFFKLIVLTLICLVAVGVVAVKGGFQSSEPAQETTSQKVDPAESLDTGRLYVSGAKKNIEAKDFEAAALQLKAALPFLNEGNCPQEELNEVYILLAETTLSNDELLISRDLWAQLADNIPSIRERAFAKIDQADKGLRLRAERLLKEAAVDLKKGRDSAALAKSRQALDLFEDFAGSDDQQGRAHGMMGKAYLAKLVKPPARRHLILAERLAPNPEYTRLLNKIGRQGPTDAPDEPASQSPTVVHNPSVIPDINNGIPQAGRINVVNRPKPKPAKPVGSTASNTAPQQQRMKEVPAHQRKTNDRRNRQKSATNTQFVNYQDKTKK